MIVNPDQIGIYNSFSKKMKLVFLHHLSLFDELN